MHTLLGDQKSSLKEMAMNFHIWLLGDKTDPAVAEPADLIERQHRVQHLIRRCKMGGRLMERATEFHDEVIVPRKIIPSRLLVMGRKQKGADATGRKDPIQPTG